MTPRKRELLDVLRQRKDREAGIGSSSSSGGPLKPPSRSFDFTIPPAFFKIAGGVVVIALVLWGLYTMFGGPKEVTYGVLANRYDMTRQGQGVIDGRTLVELQYDAVKLLQVSNASGQEQLVLFVGREADPAALEDTLQRIQNTSLEGDAGEYKFRAASIEIRPDSAD
jgi:hypothetical protein